MCDAGSPIAAVSFVELALGIADVSDFLFPFRRPHDGKWESCSLGLRLEKPTVTYLVRVIKDVLVSFLDLVDCSGAFCRTFNKVGLRIMHPTPGVFLRISQGHFDRFQSLVLDFTAKRPIRRAADLAKPP